MFNFSQHHSGDNQSDNPNLRPLPFPHQQPTGNGSSHRLGLPDLMDIVIPQPRVLQTNTGNCQSAPNHPSMALPLTEHQMSVQTPSQTPGAEYQMGVAVPSKNQSQTPWTGHQVCANILNHNLSHNQRTEHRMSAREPTNTESSMSHRQSNYQHFPRLMDIEIPQPRVLQTNTDNCQSAPNNPTMALALTEHHITVQTPSQTPGAEYQMRVTVPSKNQSQTPWTGLQVCTNIPNQNLSQNQRTEHRMSAQEPTNTESSMSHRQSNYQHFPRLMDIEIQRPRSLCRNTGESVKKLCEESNRLCETVKFIEKQDNRPISDINADLSGGEYNTFNEYPNTNSSSKGMQEYSNSKRSHEGHAITQVSGNNIASTGSSDQVMTKFRDCKHSKVCVEKERYAFNNFSEGPNTQELSTANIPLTEHQMIPVKNTYQNQRTDPHMSLPPSNYRQLPGLMGIEIPRPQSSHRSTTDNVNQLYEESNRISESSNKYRRVASDAADANMVERQDNNRFLSVSRNGGARRSNSQLSWSVPDVQTNVIRNPRKHDSGANLSRNRYVSNWAASGNGKPGGKLQQSNPFYKSSSPQANKRSRYYDDNDSDHSDKIKRAKCQTYNDPPQQVNDMTNYQFQRISKFRQHDHSRPNARMHQNRHGTWDKSTRHASKHNDPINEHSVIPFVCSSHADAYYLIHSIHRDLKVVKATDSLIHLIDSFATELRWKHSTTEAEYKYAIDISFVSTINSMVENMQEFNQKAITGSIKGETDIGGKGVACGSGNPVSDKTTSVSSKPGCITDKIMDNVNKTDTFEKTPCEIVASKLRTLRCQPFTSLEEELTTEWSICTDESNNSMERNYYHHSPQYFALKRMDPDRLNPELWFNTPGQVLDGPACHPLCDRSSGIAHGWYPGNTAFPSCDPFSNNLDRLHHYVISVSPTQNYFGSFSSTIFFDDHTYKFQGFSIFSHESLDELKSCNFYRYNLKYTISVDPQKPPTNFTIKELDLITDYIFYDLLELFDWTVDKQFVSDSGCCRQFHFLPRFVRSFLNGGLEVLSASNVLLHLLNSHKPLFTPELVQRSKNLTEKQWLDLEDDMKNHIVMFPGKKPQCLRVDVVDREHSRMDVDPFPVIVHFGVRPPQDSHTGDAEYKKLRKQFTTSQRAFKNNPYTTQVDSNKLAEMEKLLIKQKLSLDTKREVVVEVSSRGAIKVGLKCDVFQFATLLPIVAHAARYRKSSLQLECNLGYQFVNKTVLDEALTHPSCYISTCTNTTQVRVSCFNLGFRNPELGDVPILTRNSRRHGDDNLVRTLAQLGENQESVVPYIHYEKLEYLGDAVLGFIISEHIFFLFPEMSEGDMSLLRGGLASNLTLSKLSERFQLDQYLLQQHTTDLPHFGHLWRAKANSLEALLAALYIDGGIDIVRKIIANLLFDEDDLKKLWLNFPNDLVQETALDPVLSELFENSKIYKEALEFIDKLGIQFRNKQLLIKAVSSRCHFNLVTYGNNQRLEWFGDAIMNYVVADFVYRHFPNHHEGHLSILRSSLVRGKTQAKVAFELGLNVFANHLGMSLPEQDNKYQLSHRKLLADILEAFVAALYCDQGLHVVQEFIRVCFMEKLPEIIATQGWNDAKNQLHTCCLPLCASGQQPSVPEYDIVDVVKDGEAVRYTAEVSFRGFVLGRGTAVTITTAKVCAANDALNTWDFPKLRRQYRILKRVHGKDARITAGNIDGSTYHVQRKPLPKELFSGAGEVTGRESNRKRK